MNASDELLEVFKGEVGEQLEQLAEQLALPPSRWNLDSLFHLSHNVKGAGRMIGARTFAEVAHGLEDVFGALRSDKRVTKSMATLAREGAALLETCLENVEEGTQPDLGDYAERVARALRRGRHGSDASRAEPSRGTREPAKADEPAAAPTSTAAATGEAEPASTDDASSPFGLGAAATIRVGIDKLQAMMGLGAEVLASSHRTELRRSTATQLVGQISKLRRRHPELAHDDTFQRALQMSKEMLRGLTHDGARNQQLSEQLQEALRQLRMVRIDTLRGLLGRAVRSAAEATGRSVEFRTEGGSTEIDRAILERLRDPLVHLVRNAVAHGIEDAAQRQAAGKRETGVVTFSARSAGSWVEVTVEDDGRGVDLERVRAKAVREGLIDAKEDAEVRREELLDFLFHPGFTTAERVSELAGRGYGMDIVRTNLAEMGGSVTLASEAGKGTRLRLRAPLTRLTIRGLVVQAGGQPIAFPMMGIERTIPVRRPNIRTVDTVEVIAVDDTLVPINHVGRTLGLEGAVPEESPAVVLSEGHRRCAFLVDEIVGEKEFTIQALPWNLPHVTGVAGVAVTESGDVLLVLNVHELLGASGGGTLSLASRGSSESVRQYRILVVDDSVTSRTLEKNILSSAGYHVLMAVDGETALRQLREHEVDLVVTDVDMPVMDGIELTRAIRATKGLAQLPIILVTSLGSDQDKQHGAEAGADAHIVKGTFDQDELLKAVSRLL